MLLNVSMFVYVQLLACTHIYARLRKRVWERKSGLWWGGNGLLQSEFLFLSNFMEAKGLFWFEYEMSVLWGICRVMMMIKIKTIITLLFYVVWYLWAGSKNDDRFWVYIYIFIYYIFIFICFGYIYIYIYIYSFIYL